MPVIENRFRDQVAIVTGAASGIGKGIALRLAAEGAHVALFDLNAEAVQQTATEFVAQGYSAEGVAIDITQEAQVQEAVARGAENYGRLDVMVNCAGIVGPSGMPIAEYETAAFDRVMNINLRGSFLMTKYTIPFMLPRNYGRVLLIASISGKDGNPNMIGYSTSKAAVIGLTKAVGKEYSQTGITINALAPAAIHTPMIDTINPAQVEYMKARIPMGRLGTVDEVASIACWIVSPEATFNTGAIFDLTGGRAVY